MGCLLCVCVFNVWSILCFYAAAVRHATPSNDQVCFNETWLYLQMVGSALLVSEVIDFKGCQVAKLMQLRVLSNALEECLQTWAHQPIVAKLRNIATLVWVNHDDVIKWKHFPRNWPFVREIHRSPVNFPHKGQWRGALMFSLMYACINDWVNNREAGDLRLQHGHYDVIVMTLVHITITA